MKQVGIEIKLYNLDTFKMQTDVNFIDLDSELVDLNYNCCIFDILSIRVVVDSTDILKYQTIASNDKTLASFKHQKSLKNNKWIGRISHFAS